MHIRDYFHHIQSLLDRISSISSQNFAFDERSEFIGYIKGQISFVDGSYLYVSEYIDVEYNIDKIKYSYHLMQEEKILFRYDNASDPHARHLGTYPHHRHALDGKLIESLAPTLEDVLEEVKLLLRI